jgi:hypothetical protein
MWVIISKANSECYASADGVIGYDREMTDGKESVRGRREASMKKPETLLSSEPMPSQITAEYWLYAVRKRGQYPKATAKSGKWLVFVPVSRVDEVWAKIREATEDGRLGDSAKVATAKPNSNATDPSKKVICVYTYDRTDEEDVRRIRDELRALGIVSKIPYKTDRDTTAGRYAKRGHQRISKYYE